MNIKIPVMIVGRYAGVPVHQLPNSYLRWMMSQNFSKEILEIAEKKLKKSNYNDLYLSISRHAIDMFSKRFLFHWMKRENIRGEAGDGLATYMAKCAQDAWEKGEDVSKHRHIDDGTVKLHEGILWVFKSNAEFPDYKDLVTVMENK